MLFIIVNRNKNYTIIRKEFFEQVQPRPHHTEPFVMPLQIFVINGCVLGKPLLYQWTIYVVVVDPTLVAGVVGRIDVDAFDTVGVARK